VDEPASAALTDERLVQNVCGAGSEHTWLYSLKCHLIPACLLGWQHGVARTTVI